MGLAGGQKKANSGRRAIDLNRACYPMPTYGTQTLVWHRPLPKKSVRGKRKAAGAFEPFCFQPTRSILGHLSLMHGGPPQKKKKKGIFRESEQPIPRESSIWTELTQSATTSTAEVLILQKQGLMRLSREMEKTVQILARNLLITVGYLDTLMPKKPGAKGHRKPKNPRQTDIEEAKKQNMFMGWESADNLWAGLGVKRIIGFASARACPSRGTGRHSNEYHRARTEVDSMWPWTIPPFRCGCLKKIGLPPFE